MFAAEATARLTRTPGFAVLTAGPGVTNGISAITTAHFNGSSVVVLGGRAPDYRWGAGQPAGVRPPGAAAGRSPSGPGPSTTRPGRPVGQRGVRARRRPASRAGVPRREPGGAVRHAGAGAPPEPVSQPSRPGQRPARRAGPRRRPARPRSPSCWPAPARPVLVLGSDVWLDGAEDAARRGRRGAAACRSSPTARAAASCPPGTSCWSPGPGRSRSARPTWSSWSGRRWTSGSATASSAARTAPRRPGRARRRRPGPARHPPSSSRRAAAGDLTAFFTGS